MLINDARRS